MRSVQIRHIGLLLVLGIAAGVLLPGYFTRIFGQSTLYIFLPALIFEGAWHLDLPVVRAMWRPIVLLAVPGVVLTAGIVAVIAHYFGGFEWTAALLLGTILSATDPVAVLAIFRRLKVPKALSTIVETESLLNDAVAVVAYRAVLIAFVFSEGMQATERAVLLACGGIAGGIALGVAAAYVTALALRTRVSVQWQIAATLIGAYATYAVSDRVGLSGIFSVIAFGMALRWLERCRVSVTAAAGVATFWHRIDTAANILLFFLIGAALDFTRLFHALPAAGVTLAAVFAARVVLAYGLLGLVQRKLHHRWFAVVRMAGIRGALSLALALATPQTLPQRGLIIDAAFAVVVVTLFVASLTMDWRLRRLDLDATTAPQ